MTEHYNRYLLESLPMTDVLVLDEADRMIADGHFKELRDILAHVYTQRLKIKTKKPKEEIEEIHRVSADLIKQLNSTEEEFQKIT
jgi:superfamily II DNA/RNA helicase